MSPGSDMGRAVIPHVQPQKWHVWKFPSPWRTLPDTDLAVRYAEITDVCKQRPVLPQADSPTPLPLLSYAYLMTVWKKRRRKKKGLHFRRAFDILFTSGYFPFTFVNLRLQRKWLITLFLWLFVKPKGINSVICCEQLSCGQRQVSNTPSVY